MDQLIKEDSQGPDVDSVVIGSFVDDLWSHVLIGATKSCSKQGLEEEGRRIRYLFSLIRWVDHPKSQSLMFKSWSRRRFSGFISRCMTSFLCR